MRAIILEPCMLAVKAFCRRKRNPVCYLMYTLLSIRGMSTWQFSFSKRVHAMLWIQTRSVAQLCIREQGWAFGAGGVTNMKTLHSLRSPVCLASKHLWMVFRFQPRARTRFSLYVAKQNDHSDAWVYLLREGTQCVHYARVELTGPASEHHGLWVDSQFVVPFGAISRNKGNPGETTCIDRWHGCDQG